MGIIPIKFKTLIPKLTNKNKRKMVLFFLVIDLLKNINKTYIKK